VNYTITPMFKPSWSVKIGKKNSFEWKCFETINSLWCQHSKNFSASPCDLPFKSYQSVKINSHFSGNAWILKGFIPLLELLGLQHCKYFYLKYGHCVNYIINSLCKHNSHQHLTVITTLSLHCCLVVQQYTEVCSSPTEHKLLTCSH